MASDLLTFSIDLDYINVDSIQRYVSFLQTLIDKEIEKENLKPISKRRTFAKIRELTEDTKVETQVDNVSLDGFEDTDLSKKTKAEISELCKAKNLKFTKKTTKIDLIKLLEV